MLKRYANICCIQKNSRSLVTGLQMKSGRLICQKIFECYKKRDFILDNESYFMINNFTLTGNDRFYSQDKENVPLFISYNFQNKLEQKILVWVVNFTSWKYPCAVFQLWASYPQRGILKSMFGSWFDTIH